MSKKLKVVMIASLVAPIVLGAQPTQAENKLINPTESIPMASATKSDVDKLIDEIYSIYNKIMKNKTKITSKEVRDDERDLDHAVNKLVIKFQREVLTDKANRTSNKKILQDILRMKREVTQLVRKEVIEKQEEKEKEIKQEEKETAELNAKIIEKSVSRMNDVVTKKEGTSTFAVVTSWESFKKALEEGVADIQITESLTATSKAVVKENATVNIMGADGVEINLSDFTIELGKGSQVTAENLSFKGNQKGIAFTGKGDLTLKGKITALDNTKAPLVQLPDNTLTLDEAIVKLPKGLLMDADPIGTDKYLGHMDSKNWIVKGSSIDSEAAAIFVQSAHKTDKGESTVTISEGSKITGASLGLEVNRQTLEAEVEDERSVDNGLTEMFYFSRKTNFLMEGSKTTVSLKTDMLSGKNMVMANMAFLESESVINIDGATLDIHAEHVTALLAYGEKTAFNFSNQSKVNLYQHDSKSSVSSKEVPAAATFRIANSKDTNNPATGSNIFSVTGHSELTITKESGVSPAVRMVGDSNQFITEEGSDITITQNGPIESLSEGSNIGVGDFAAIFYGGGEVLGSSNLFKIKHSQADKEENKEDFAQVNLHSESGPAIVSNKGELEIQADANTYFTARGNILDIGPEGKKKASATIDSKDKLTFNMNEMSYFDFRNSYKDDNGNPSENARVFNTTNASSTFTSIKSDLAVWPSGSDVEGAPADSWPIMDVYANGSGFKNLDLEKTTNDKFKEDYAKYQFGNLARITANNQAPIIDQLRVPTNADKFIYGHALVPEGKFDPPRDAYADEVFVNVELYDDKGNITKLKGHTANDKDKDGKAIYGEESRKGIFEIAVPDDKYLSLGQSIRTTEAWRSVENPKEGVHISDENHLIAVDQTVQDVTPPDTPLVDRDKISYLTKEITGYAKEPGTIKLARGEKEILKTQVETDENVTEGKGYRFNLPIPSEIGLKEGDKLTVLSRNIDQPKEKTVNSSENPEAVETVEMPNINPSTFDENIGNITPIDGPMEYHDLKGKDGFKPGAKVEVIGGELTMVGNPNFNFHSQKITTETQTYWPDVEGDHIIVTDTLGQDSEGWTLTLQELTKKPSGKNPLFNNMFYVKEKGAAGKHLTESPQIVAASTDSDKEVVDITGSWTKGETGLEATIPVPDQVVGKFEATLGWNLVKGVPNSDE